MATGTIQVNNWNYLGLYQGTTARDLPTNAHEYLVILHYGTSGGIQSLSFPFVFPNDSHISAQTFTAGYYLSATAFGFAQINASCSTHKVSIVLMNISGTDYSSTSYLKIFYR